MKTQEEILARISERRGDDIFGFEWLMYLEGLNYENGKQFLKEKNSDEQKLWDEKFLDTKEKVIDKLKNYMEFAWEKANDGRGISANRSISHYIAWTWLIGDDQISQEIERKFEDEYEFYGKNILVYICDQYGIDHKKYDDGVREN